MKKLLSLLVFLLAFSLSSNAQATKKEQSPETKGKLDLLEVTKVIDVSGTENLFVNLNQLFVTKHKMLSKVNITANEKEEITKLIDTKLRGYLSGDQIKSLESAALYQNLIH